MFKTFSFVPLLAIAAALPGMAQTSRLALSVGGGFTEPVRYTNGPLKVGGNFTGSAGVNLSKYVGISAEFGFSSFGINQSRLDELAVPNGSTRMYSVTLQPTFHFNPDGRVDVYSTIGGGYYRRTIEFTEPTTALVTAFDPFFGFYNALIPAQTVLGSFTQNKGGINGGIGVAIRVTSDSAMRIFAETRYHHVFTSGRDTNYMPVTFGLRW
jgi:hypothetical protein